jgi:HD superfamily phosphohydrolase YqeK
LEQQKLWENNNPKEYHTQLVDILRIYMEERFGVNVMELTSDEILHKVALHKEMTSHRMLLSNIFYIADLAKFAKAQPTPQEHMAAMDYAKQFIMATKPVVVVEPQNPPTAS